MNFFYGVNNRFLKSEIQIPTFQNRYFRKSTLQLFKVFPKNNKWVLKEVINKKINDFFYVLKNEDILNNEIFFLADNSIFDKFNHNKLENFNNFTDTSPAFRSNLKIYLDHGGFSSYQSEYPYDMITKKGSILSSISSIANTDADQNYVLIRNIFEEPIEDNFKAYLVNHETKKIEEQFNVKTNYTNCIKIDKKFIKPEIFLVTNDYLGIPMYVSVKDNFLSFEHTHPPHEYFLSKNKFQKVASLKKEINEIII
ncbi:hypothetical protein OA868_03715 [Candidatus Pelagibacter sp.]|nr:hypothetical protein [Candidatus Pelagibacter sp.]